jgi:hypothetical protein
LDFWITDRIIFSNAVHARLPEGHGKTEPIIFYDINNFIANQGGFIEIGQPK